MCASKIFRLNGGLTDAGNYKEIRFPAVWIWNREQWLLIGRVIKLGV